ncbi:uncharacterized protein LOC131651266 [Vicia villosa]|uniref:uncharacterized protein LOC131651266 n=1 Tax=Vicia villosa TaxID=3911 RepID=UPI00273BF49B|nr:uncharacterized protein LOC131651266 [Vicia villosa]
MVKRGRGRPKTAVPPSPRIPTTPASQPVVVTPTRTEEVTKPENTVKAPETETLIEKNDSPKLWVDILNENRNPTKGDFDVEIEDEDVSSKLQFWENTFVLYGLGEDLSMNVVKNFMAKTWNFVTLPDMYYHEDGYFLLRFKSHDDMDAVMMKGPYTLRNIPLIIKEWRPDYNVKEDLLRTLPIWIKLPKLPLHLWGARCLNKIGSLLGIPLVTDECTTHKLRVSYARILVEVDITRKLIDEINIKDLEGRKLKQPIEYEWRPKFCDKCQRVGHQCGAEVQKKVWRPKPPPETKEQVQVNTTPTNVENTQGEELKWTTVAKTNGDRGKKKIIYPDPNNDIACDNGFDVLGILNDPLVIIGSTS